MKQLTNEVNVDPVVFQPRNVNDPGTQRDIVQPECE
jgi:hypothetical protein